MYRPDIHNLTAMEFAVIDALAMATETASSVVLAAELWAPGSRWDVGDPCGLMAWVVESLGAQGVVTYRVRRTALNGVPTNIRLTPLGWELAGYPVAGAEVGRARRGIPAHTPLRPGDTTDYRGHRETAEGGPIERLPYAAHRAKYPTHIHPMAEGRP